jgi:cation diffusion facilitator family transporter
MEEDSKERNVQIVRITLWGSLCNFLLLSFKFIAGILGHSSAMIADAVHSLSDFITDIIVLIFVHISAKPQDESHDYGHGKYETLATSIIGIVLLGVGFGLFWSGANKIYDYYVNGKQLESPGMIAFIAAIVSIVVKEILYRVTVHVGEREKSQAVIANAWHHRSDALSSIGTALGIGGAILLGEKWHVLDPLAAVVVSIFIVKVSLQLVIPSINELLEKSLPSTIEDEIIRIITESPEVKDPHNLRTRQIGNNIAIEVHIRMNGETTVARAHVITKEIEARLRKHFGRSTHISLHVEPIK